MSLTIMRPLPSSAVSRGRGVSSPGVAARPPYRHWRRARLPAHAQPPPWPPGSTLHSQVACACFIAGQPRVKEARAKLGLEVAPELTLRQANHATHGSPHIGPRWVVPLSSRVETQERIAQRVGGRLRAAKATRDRNCRGTAEDGVGQFEAVHATFEDLCLHVGAHAHGEETVARTLVRDLFLDFLPRLPSG